MDNILVSYLYVKTSFPGCTGPINQKSDGILNKKEKKKSETLMSQFILSDSKY